MRTNIITLLFGCALFMAACEDTPASIPGHIYAKSYIQVFCPAENLKTTVTVSTYRIDETDNSIISPLDYGVVAHTITEPVSVAETIDLSVVCLGTDPDNPTCDELFDEDSGNLQQFLGESSPYIGSGNRTELYKTLVAQIGDTSFDRTVFGVNYLAAVSLLDTVRTVTVVCDKNFDATHPAGSSLNDLFTISFNEPLVIIQNNYQAPAGMYRYRTLDSRPTAVVRAPLSTVVFSDHPFMSCYWDCILNSAPDKTDTYTFTVKVVLENGKELQSSASIAIKGAEE